MPCPPPLDATEPVRQRTPKRPRRQRQPRDYGVVIPKEVQRILRKVVSPLLKVKDHWFRFEWQHRGSSHVHDLVWLEDAPSVNDLDLSVPDLVDSFLDFWQSRVSTHNPAPDLAPARLHPCSIPHDRLGYTSKELAELLNRVQRHTRCTDVYCRLVLRARHRMR